MTTKIIQRKSKSPAHKNKPARHSSIKIHRILVPIDFSEYSKNALKYAIPFAQQFKASIDLIYVVEPAIYPADFSFGQMGFPNIENELSAHGNEELEELIKNEISGKVASRKIVRTGKPFYEINQYAQEENIDLIIIATHGHSGMEHILFGSTAEKVVRKAPCPVLVVRTGEHEFVKAQGWLYKQENPQLCKELRQKINSRRTTVLLHTKIGGMQVGEIRVPDGIMLKLVF